MKKLFVTAAIILTMTGAAQSKELFTATTNKERACQIASDVMNISSTREACTRWASGLVAIINRNANYPNAILHMCILSIDNVVHDLSQDQIHLNRSDASDMITACYMLQWDADEQTARQFAEHFSTAEMGAIFNKAWDTYGYMLPRR
jgi:hypothetical protein